MELERKQVKRKYYAMEMGLKQVITHILQLYEAYEDNYPLQTEGLELMLGNIDQTLEIIDKMRQNGLI